MERQVVVITGASAGVGRAVARAYGVRGAAIGLLARGLERLEAARHEVDAAGGRAIAIPCDVADAAAVETAADRVERELGPIGVWINNAMVSIFAPVSEITSDEYRRVTEVTYLGYVHGTQAALRRMRPRDRGVIVQVGSALAYRGIPLQSAYCAAKHAIEGFCDSLWSELLHDESKVRVALVHLPAINTPQFDWVRSRLPGRAQPVPPIYEPEVAAEAIVWAADHHHREVMVGWPVAEAILSDRIAPRLTDRYLAAHGYEAQQTADPEDPNRPDNLWQPPPGDPGARGRFSAQARSTSWLFRSGVREPWVPAAITALATLALVASVARTRRR